MDKMKMESVDITAENIDKIGAIFPNCITETIDENGKIKKAINFEVLKQILSDDIINGDEAYEFTWVGKKAAMFEANKPIRKTLRPCKNESVDWNKTENLYIEGDNLDVLKLLQESYLGKIKMIYIDPPYNTGSDRFIYPDDFSMQNDEYEEVAKVFDDKGNKLFKENSNTNPQFHSKWCSMIYQRLILARNLLSDNGVIFISIDDNEMENLKKICDEVFGLSNYCGTFIVNSTPNARDYGHIGKMHEFCLFYGKNALLTETNMLPEVDKKFKYFDEKGGYNIHPLYNSNEAFHKLNRPNLFYPFYVYLDHPVKNEKGFYKIGLDKKENSIEIYPPKSLKNGVQFVWRWGKNKAEKYMNEEIIGYEVSDGEFRVVQKMRHSEKIIRSLLTDTKYSSRRGTAEVEELLNGKVFSFPKPLALLSDLCLVGLNKNDIVLDFFSGSATTAHAIMQLNSKDNLCRKFIMVQYPEKTAADSLAREKGYKTICDIGIERIRRAAKKIKQENPQAIFDGGFRVLKLDDTNMTDVYYGADEYNQDMLAKLESNLKPDRTDLDLLFGCLLEWGLPLSMPYTSENIEGCMVHTYNDGDLIACFDENVPESVVKEIAKRRPLRAVFRDRSFASSPAKINVTEIFKLLAPDTRVKVI